MPHLYCRMHTCDIVLFFPPSPSLSLPHPFFVHASLSLARLFSLSISGAILLCQIYRKRGHVTDCVDPATYCNTHTATHLQHTQQHTCNTPETHLQHTCNTQLYRKRGYVTEFVDPATYCNTHTATHTATHLQHTCNTLATHLQHSALSEKGICHGICGPWNTLQHTLQHTCNTHCNTHATHLKHTCNTHSNTPETHLQHTCNTQLYRKREHVTEFVDPATHCNTHTATHLQHTCNILATYMQHSALSETLTCHGICGHCNTLQHTLCNTPATRTPTHLQHTCNTPATLSSIENGDMSRNLWTLQHAATHTLQHTCNKTETHLQHTCNTQLYRKRGYVTEFVDPATHCNTHTAAHLQHPCNTPATHLQHSALSKTGICHGICGPHDSQSAPRLSTKTPLFVGCWVCLSFHHVYTHTLIYIHTHICIHIWTLLLACCAAPSSENASLSQLLGVSLLLPRISMCVFTYIHTYVYVYGPHSQVCGAFLRKRLSSSAVGCICNSMLNMCVYMYMCIHIYMYEPHQSPSVRYFIPKTPLFVGCWVCLSSYLTYVHIYIYVSIHIYIYIYIWTL